MKKYGVVVLIYTQTIVPIISDLPFCQKLGDYPKSFSENLKIYTGWKFRFSIFTLLTVKIDINNISWLKSRQEYMTSREKFYGGSLSF